jgi:hypothetical protein
MHNFITKVYTITVYTITVYTITVLLCNLHSVDVDIIVHFLVIITNNKKYTVHVLK